MAALDDTSASVRTTAADALGKVLAVQPRSPKVVQALISALGDPVDDVRMAAATALATEGVRAQGAIPGVHAALHDTAHASVRAHAALILGNLGSKAGQDAVPALMEALTDANPQVRSASAEALGKFGRQAASSVPSLRSHLGDADPSVRLKVLEALFNIGTPDSITVPALVNALSDSAGFVRAAAAYMLGGLGTSSEPELDALAAAMRDPDSEVRAAAVFAVAEIGPPARAAIPALRLLLQDGDSQVRQFAKAAISRIDNPQRLPENSPRRGH